MLLVIPEILDPDRLALCRERLAQADWQDGRITAGPQSSQVKANQQLPETDPAAQAMSDMVLRALEQSPLFLSAALPRHVFPPLFNRYAPGMSFGAHIDNAIRQVPGTTHRLRTDLSATLFLSDPADYEGGELMVDDAYGAHSIKLAAGDLVLYPASSLHRVMPVTRGTRLAAFFWIQSMVRDDGERTLLFDLDGAIQRVTTLTDDPAVVQLTGIYHNLLRRWAEL
jgi:PKHD-type hydroxylase